MKAKVSQLPQKFKQIATRAKALFCCICTIILCNHSSANADNGTAAEYAVKAAYVYNILQFIDWEETHPLKQSTSLNVCLFEDNPFQQYIDPIQDKSISNRLIKLKTINNLSESTDCHLVFIDHHENINHAILMERFKNSDAILLGNNINFINDGGLFGFYIENNKVKLGANINAIANTRLKISSLLIEVCQLYGELQ